MFKQLSKKQDFLKARKIVKKVIYNYNLYNKTKIL